MLNENIFITMDIIWKRPSAIFPSINMVNQQWFIIWKYQREIVLRIPHKHQLNSIRSNFRFKALANENETPSPPERLVLPCIKNLNTVGVSKLLGSSFFHRSRKAIPEEMRSPEPYDHKEPIMVGVQDCGRSPENGGVWIYNWCWTDALLDIGV